MSPSAFFKAVMSILYVLDDIPVPEIARSVSGAAPEITASSLSRAIILSRPSGIVVDPSTFIISGDNVILTLPVR